MTKPALWVQAFGKPKVNKPVKWIPRKSEHQKKRDYRYSKVRAEYLKRNPWCRMCGKGATDIHHRNGKVSNLLFDTRYFTAVCSGCHDWCHRNIELARQKGMICQKGKWNSND